MTEDVAKVSEETEAAAVEAVEQEEPNKEHEPCRDDDCDCGTEMDLGDFLDFEVGFKMSMLRDYDMTSNLGCQCRAALFDVLCKEDLTDDKIKGKLAAMWQFLQATERRSDELVSVYDRIKADEEN